MSIKSAGPTRFTISKASAQSIPSTKSAKFTAAAAEAEIMANAALVLIAVACSLLDRQLARLSRDFEEKGGFTERMYQRRVEKRNRPGKGS